MCTAARRAGDTDRLDALLRQYRVGGTRCFAREFDELQTVDRTAWRNEVIDHEEMMLDLHDHLPPEMIYERELLICRMWRGPGMTEAWVNPRRGAQEP